jgi:hypothetical protein
VKLRGRLRRQAALRSNEAHRALPERPEGRRGRTLSSRARGAKQEARHGPLQRLLEGAPSIVSLEPRVAPEPAHAEHYSGWPKRCCQRARFAVPQE